MKNVLIAGY